MTTTGIVSRFKEFESLKDKFLFQCHRTFMIDFYKILTLSIYCFFSPFTDTSFICLYDQGDLNTVDFVLISRPFKSNDDPGFSNPPHVMSHHACHFRYVSPMHNTSNFYFIINFKYPCVC